MHKANTLKHLRIGNASANACVELADFTAVIAVHFEFCGAFLGIQRVPIGIAEFKGRYLFVFNIA